jgi:hypothetical protein
VPPPGPPPPGPAFEPVAVAVGDLCRGTQLVVARHAEDIAWTAAVPFPVLVYNAGDPIGPPADHVAVIPRPNVGREAGAYLRHIVSRFHLLADLTVFCQGHPFDHCPDFLARIAAPWDAPTPLATRYLETVPPAWIKARDRVETRHGFEVRWGDATIDGHADAGAPGRSWHDPAAWPHVFAGPMPRPLWFGYSATWAVPRAAVHARPLNLWRWLLRESDAAGHATTSRSEPPLNAWMFEATWNYLWESPAAYPHRAGLPCGCPGGP